MNQLFLFFLATALTYNWNASGITVAGTGTAGSNVNQLNTPFGIFMDSFNALYIADYGYNRIQKWLSGASTGTTVAGQASGASGSTAAYLNGPTGIIVDSSGNMYIADCYNYRVQFWANGSTSGTTIAGTTGMNEEIFSNSCQRTYVKSIK